ncbi:MAG: insulinase family protein, partial [bacterium]|nr:insulinase family protein [bacterium]
DFNSEEIKERLGEKLSQLPQRHSPFPKLARPEPLKELKEIITRRDKKQAHIVFGFLGTTVKSEDKYPLEVLNNVLAGQGGRLFLELRDKKGLAYAISSQAVEGIEPGFFAVYMGTDPKKLDEALSGIRRELKKISTDLISADELDRSKNYIVGNYELDLQRNGAVASFLASDTLFGLGVKELHEYPEKIRKVTRAQVLEAAQKYLTQERAVLSVIKP